MSLINDIPELVKANVISEETAEKIRLYYQEKKVDSQTKLFVIFAVLGAILVGLGIILILAHNWDELSRKTKTFFAFLPLVVGQVLCGYSLLKKRDDIAWKESTTVFLFFAVGASISLVGQIYNIEGNLSRFLLAWMLLCFPLIYVMNSSIGSLLYIAGITYYACETGLWSYPKTEPYFYWILLLISFPHYYQLYKNKPQSNFIIFHHWLIPLSVMICLGTITKGKEELMFVAYFGLFGLYYLIGNSTVFKNQESRNNSYLNLGSLGTIILLLMLSFDWFWNKLKDKNFQLNELIFTPEFVALAVLTFAAGIVFYFQKRNQKMLEIKPIEVVFVLFIIIFIIGLEYPHLSIILINLVVLTIGILTIIQGAKLDHLGILNYGLLIITTLVICRFFDTDLSFIARGFLFISVGVGFFLTNYYLLKKRKKNE